MSTVTACSNCPFARQIEGNRYECSATHKQGLDVVRGHWVPTQDCQDAIASRKEKLVEAVAKADQQHEDGYKMGKLDARYNTQTYSDLDTPEWMEGYWTGYEDYVREMIDVAKHNSEIKAKRDSGMAKLGAGWRIIDGYFVTSWGGRYNIPPASYGLTDDELAALKA